MKAECNYCGKLLKDPFVDTDQKGRFYFFCDQKHRDLFEQRMLEISLLLNPGFQAISLCGVIWRSIFKRKEAKEK